MIQKQMYPIVAAKGSMGNRYSVGMCDMARLASFTTSMEMRICARSAYTTSAKMSVRRSIIEPNTNMPMESSGEGDEWMAAPRTKREIPRTERHAVMTHVAHADMSSHMAPLCSCHACRMYVLSTNPAMNRSVNMNHVRILA